MSYCASLCYILIYVCDLDQHLFKSLFSPKYIFALKLVCPPVSLSLLGFLRVANSFKLALIYLCLKLIIGLPTLYLLYTRSTQHTGVTISPPHIGGQRKFGGYIDPMYIHYFFTKMLASNNFITTSIDFEEKKHSLRMWKPFSFLTILLLFLPRAHNRLFTGLRYLSGSVCPLVLNTKDRLSWILKHRMHRSVCSPYGWEFCTF